MNMTWPNGTADVKCEVGAPPLKHGGFYHLVTSVAPGDIAPKMQKKRCLGKPCCFPPKIRLESKGL